MKAALVGLVLVAGCGPRKSAAFVVSNVSVVGNELVVESCKLTGIAGQTDCSTSSQPVPLIPVPAPPPATRDIAFTIQHGELANKLAESRAAIDACAGNAKVTTPFKIRLEIDGSGQVLGATADTTNADLAACVTAALVPTKFVVSTQGMIYTFKPGAR